MDTEQTTWRTVAAETRALVGIITKTSGRIMHERMTQSGMGVTPIQGGLLHMLEMRPHTISELSKMFHLDASTLVPAVDYLEERGLVERRKDPLDRRRVPLHLTEPGREVLDNLNRVTDDDPMLGAIRTLGFERAVLLRDLLRDVLNALPEGTSALCALQDRLARLDVVQPSSTATTSSSET